MFCKSLAAMTIAAVLFIIPSAQAHDGATGIIKERMKIMEFVAQNTKMIAPFAMGAFEMNYKSVEGSARQISMGAERVLDKFPKGSTSEVSEARDNIWEEWDEFKALFLKLAKDAGDLADMAKNNEGDIKAQFEVMAQNCKTCHTKFRQKKH